MVGGIEGLTDSVRGPWRALHRTIPGRRAPLRLRSLGEDYHLTRAVSWCSLDTKLETDPAQAPRARDAALHSRMWSDGLPA